MLRILLMEWTSGGFINSEMNLSTQSTRFTRRNTSDLSIDASRVVVRLILCVRLEGLKYMSYNSLNFACIVRYCKIPFKQKIKHEYFSTTKFLSAVFSSDSGFYCEFYKLSNKYFFFFIEYSRQVTNSPT